MIPKRIYFTWIGSPITERAEKNIQKCREIMPDYEIEIITKYDGTIENPTVASNYLRLQYLYDNGGIYLDTDIEVIKRFDDLLDNEAFIGCEDDEWINNAVSGAVKGSEFVKRCLEKFDSAQPPNENGPKLVTTVAKEYGWDGKKIVSDRLTVYPKSYFYPYNYNEVYTPECIKPETHCIHLWDFAWNNEVSIVIPCYNHGKYLADAIESALAQTKEAEIIVVNDGSTDNTSEVAKRYPVKLIEQENKGCAAARNAGIKASTKRFILPLDADDKIDPNYVYKIIEEMKDADIVTSDLQEFGLHYAKGNLPSNYTLKDIIEHNRLVCCTAFKKSDWARVGGYDESEDLRKGYEDWDFWIRLIVYGCKVKKINETMFFYRKHGKNMSQNLFNDDSGMIEFLQNKYKKYYKDFNTTIDKSW